MLIGLFCWGSVQISCLLFSCIVCLSLVHLWELLFYNFIYLCLVYSLAMLGPSGCAELSLVAFSRDDCSCGSRVSLYGGFSCCGAWAVGRLGFGSCGSRDLGCRLNSWGLVALQHVGSSWTRDQTCVSCIGRWILYHWAIKEALKIMLFFFPPSISSFPAILLGPIYIFLTFTCFTILRFVLLSILFNA